MTDSSKFAPKAFFPRERIFFFSFSLFFHLSLPKGVKARVRPVASLRRERRTSLARSCTLERGTVNGRVYYHVDPESITVVHLGFDTKTKKKQKKLD